VDVVDERDALGPWVELALDHVRYGSGGILADRVRQDLLRKKKGSTVSTGYGSSAFGGLVDAKRAELMSGRGILLGTLDGYYLTDNGAGHVGLWGETRSRKDVSHVLPTICMEDPQIPMAQRTSRLIADPKNGVTSRQTMRHCAQVSEVVCFAPLHRVSASINVLDTVYDFRTATAVAKSHLAPAEMVQETQTSLHFRDLATVGLTAGILHVLDTRARQSMAEVLAFYSGHDELAAALQEMVATPHSDPVLHDMIVSMAKEIQQIKGAGELGGVWSTMMRALHLYRDPWVAQHTDTSDVELMNIQHGAQPVTLYLIAPSVIDFGAYSPVFRVVVETIFRLSTARPNPRPLLCSLNEFTSLGYLATVDMGSASLAEHGIRLFLIMQDLERLWNVYGKGTQIWGNLHTKIFHGAANDQTAKRVSEMLGDETVRQEVVSYQGAFFRRQRSVTYQEHARRIAKPEEVGQWPQDRALVVISGHKPLNIRKTLWYEDPIFRTRIVDVREARG